LLKETIFAVQLRLIPNYQKVNEQDTSIW